MSIKEIDIRLQISMVCSFLFLIVTIIYAVFDCLVSSVFSVGSSKEMLTFGLFVAGEEITAPRNHWEKLISQTGLWQRLSLGMMYVPYIVLSLYKK